MLKIFIMEDNSQQLVYYTELVKEICKQFHETEIELTSCSSTEEMLAVMPEASADNVFIFDIDINSNKRAGLQLSQLIRNRDHLAQIIFITVHDEFLYTTYKYRVKALDFIAKDRGNIHQELTIDLKRIIEEHKKRNSTPVFTYKSYNQTSTIPLDDICYFASNKENSHACTIHTVDHQAIQIHQNLREIEKQDSRFFRAHRGYLINPHQVRKVDFYYRKADFYNGDSCPISQRHARKLLQLIKEDK
ncbi:response regulator transcription factor [Limosilactobacillus sp. Sa3CUN2]|uniref:Response regulator transcription factor n=1 Tax=Limosilactobacillus avistercoris TaxID=2762243 RepID=A0ABR8PCX6_9LACO|nr:LytTR family DNA-binding domain-containing protein [Limosilactobacillus avistercoris]MBD7895146.1 response regulator transcription factor [Limosilactobacillus avistercoris]